MDTKPLVRFLDRTTPPHIFTLTVLAGVSALTMSVFLPSLNGMTAYFQTDYAIMQLAVSGYLAMTAVLQIFVGPLADRFGRRPMVLIGLCIFILASIGAMLSTSVELFLFFRMCQATVASGMVLSRTIVRDMVPADQAASMIGYVTMGMALVPMIGPIIGGALDELFGWQATFLFLILCGTFVLTLCYFDLGETISGTGLSFAEQLRTYPELLTSPRFWGYVGCAAFGSGAFFAFLGGAPLVAGEVFNLSPFWTGIALGSPAIGYALGNGLSGRFSVQMGIDKMILFGALIAASVLLISLLLTLSGLSHPFIFFGCCTFLGLGNGLLMPNATAGSLSVRPHLAGTASGLSGAIMIAGGALLSAWSSSLLSAETGEIPLQLIMFVTSGLSALTILFVMRRNARIAQ